MFPKCHLSVDCSRFDGRDQTVRRNSSFLFILREGPPSLKSRHRSGSPESRDGREAERPHRDSRTVRGMHALRRRLSRVPFSPGFRPRRSFTRLTAPPPPPLNSGTPRGNVLESPWSALQRRGAKVLGSDVRLGNVIQRKGRIFQVLKTQHTQHGRGGATIQVELRDVDTGNKVSERFRTDEAIERVFVEDKSFTYLYTEGDSVMLMEPMTFDQLEVSKDFFGKAACYLKDNMKVTLQLFDGKPMSASVPTRVICTVVEAQTHSKGQTAQPQYKKVLLDNGHSVMAPAFIKTGDEIVINTTDDSYITRAKE